MSGYNAIALLLSFLDVFFLLELEMRMLYSILQYRIHSPALLSYSYDDAYLTAYFFFKYFFICVYVCT